MEAHENHDDLEKAPARKGGKLRWLLEAMVALGVIVLAVAWLSGWFEPKIAPGDGSSTAGIDASGLELSMVEHVAEPAIEWASGTVESARRTTVAARIVSRVETFHVAAGDLVKQGDLLVELDGRELLARVQQARDTRDAANARLELADREFKRSEDLLKQGVTTPQRHDQVVSSQRVAAADVAKAEQGLKEAEASLSHTIVRALTAGRVIDRLAEVGDTVTPGAGLLRLYDPTVLRVEAPVRESLAVKLKVGDTLDVDLSSVGEAVTGRIEEIVPYAEPGARTLLVKVGLPSGTQAFAGMFARVGVSAGVSDRYIVPTSAIRRIGQLEFVYVEDRGSVFNRMITTGGPASPDTVSVLSGLAKGEKIATRWIEVEKQSAAN